MTRRLSGAPLDEVKAALRSVLHLEQARGPGYRPLVFHPHGTDNALIADATDLVDAMAEATSRQLRWIESSTRRCPHAAGSTREDQARGVVAAAAACAGRPTTPSSSATTATRRVPRGCCGWADREARRPVRLDATDADDITRIISEDVALRVLLLLQTKGILNRPSASSRSSRPCGSASRSSPS